METAAFHDLGPPGKSLWWKNIMQKLESRGLVLFNRTSPPSLSCENDKLVVLFNEQVGKRMFLLVVVGQVNWRCHSTFDHRAFLEFMMTK